MATFVKRLFSGRKEQRPPEREVVQHIGIKACAYSVPSHIRHNDDPLFRDIVRMVNAQGVSEVDLFTGMKERRYLLEHEHIEAYMVEASFLALTQAKLRPQDITELYGYASVPDYFTPNGLYAVHRDLQFAEKTLVIPINNEFSAFLLGVIGACNAIAAGHSEHALVVCGTNWTQYMNYTQGHALSVGDGAGAAVVSSDADFVLIDYTTQTLSDQYGAMTMQSYDTPRPSYRITEDKGIYSFQVSARHGLLDMIQTLLKKHDLTGKDIALITHQASRVLMNHWAECLQPKEYLETMECFGNLTLATYPVNLAYHYVNITAEYLVIAALGVGYHQTALLLKNRRVCRKKRIRESFEN
ncbi:MAG TPA: 3-oxoacyl-ACP synthase [Ktedonobacteraceae bacterium]|nr:3-oxoacyl-ACP synthase [Ktedonobacteraceae bacterium]